MLTIIDPTLITKANPQGHRPVTQDDVDNLQRVSMAYASLKSHLTASLHQAIGNADNIISGTPEPEMTEDEKRIYHLVEDYRYELMKPTPNKSGDGFTYLDHNGNEVAFDDLGNPEVTL